MHSIVDPGIHEVPNAKCRGTWLSYHVHSLLLPGHMTAQLEASVCLLPLQWDGTMGLSCFNTEMIMRFCTTCLKENPLPATFALYSSCLELGVTTWTYVEKDHGLEQGPANYCPCNKCGPLLVWVNKVLLKHRQEHFFNISWVVIFVLQWHRVEQLQQNIKSCKAKNIYYLILQCKILPFPTLEDVEALCWWGSLEHSLPPFLDWPATKETSVLLEAQHSGVSLFQQLVLCLI